MELKRVLSFWQVFSVAFGLVVCSTTLMIVSYGFQAEAGPSFIVSMVMAGVMMIFVALTVSELGTTFPRAGSFGVYAREALGPVAGLWAGLMYFIVFTGLAAEGLIIGQLTSMFVPFVPWQIWTFIFVTIMLIINLLGIRLVGITSVAMTIYMIAVITVASLGQIAGFGVTEFDVSKFSEFAPGGWVPIVSWAMLAVWLFVGFEVAAPLAEETKNPERNIPRGMLSAIGFIFAVQAIFGIAVFGTLDAETVFSVTYPHVIAGGVFFGTVGLLIFAANSIIATLSTYNTVMAGTSRVLWGLGRDGYIPKVGYLHPRFRTPWVALLIEYVCILILAIGLAAPVLIIAMDTMFFLLIYLAMHISVIALRQRKPNLIRPFRCGGPSKLPVIPVLGIIAILVAIYYAIFGPMGDITVLYWGGGGAAVMLAIAHIAYYGYAKKKTAGSHADS